MKIPAASLLLLCFAASAQEGPDPVPDATMNESASSIELRTDLHSEYLAGETMLVRIEVLNRHANQILRYPDLSARPWLVRFRLTDSEGRVQTRYNLAPEEDSDRQWEIPPRSRREVVLEIPSSSTFKKGRHELQIEIQQGGAIGSTLLPVHAFQIAGAKPVAGRVDYDALAVARGGHQVVWTHKASDGADLYIHHSSGESPAKTLGNYHLLHLDEPVEPVLALSSPQQVWDRHVYWMTSSRSLDYARLRGQAFRSSPKSLNFPYPAVELIGRGSTDGEGRLHIPFWVQAPSGSGGELRVASLDDRGRPRFRSVLRASERPELISTGVDSTGGLRILLGAKGELDLYTLDVSSDLPAAGARVFPVGSGVIHAEIGFLNETESSVGGMALGVVQRGDVTESGTPYQVSWATLSGTPLRSTGSFLLREGQELRSVIVMENEFWALVKYANGSHHLHNSEGPQGLIAAAALGSLVPNGEQGVVLRRLSDQGPVSTFTP